MDAGPYVRLVLERGWSVDRYQRWLAAAVRTALLDD
jgi:hypothetical protein